MITTLRNGEYYPGVMTNLILVVPRDRMIIKPFSRIVDEGLNNRNTFEAYGIP